MDGFLGSWVPKPFSVVLAVRPCGSVKAFAPELQNFHHTVLLPLSSPSTPSKTSQTPFAENRSEAQPMAPATDTAAEDPYAGVTTGLTQIMEEIESTPRPPAPDDAASSDDEPQLSDSSSDSGEMPQPHRGDNDGSSTEDEMLSPTQRELLEEPPPGQGNNFQSFLTLEPPPPMENVIDLGDEFEGDEGLQALAGKVSELQNSTRKQLEARDVWLHEHNARHHDRSEECEELRKKLEKERKARKLLWDFRIKDKKKLKELRKEHDELRKQFDELRSELKQKRARDEEEDDTNGPPGAKRARVE